LRHATAGNDIIDKLQRTQSVPSLQGIKASQVEHFKHNKGGRGDNQPQSHNKALPTMATEGIVNITMQLIPWYLEAVGINQHNKLYVELFWC
jgi:hypothetical protein